MIDPQARMAARVKLLTSVALLGLITALLTFVFMAPFTSALVQVETLPVIAVAVVVIALLTAF
jgi:hypothetical protein